MMRTKVLLVEDDESLSTAIKSRLEEMSDTYQVFQAFHGMEGIDLWKEHHPHIIVADVDMPVMDGWEMVQHIRATDSDTPILFTSILRTQGDVVKGITIGADNYLKKPFTITELDIYIKALLRRTSGAGVRVEDYGREIGIFRFTPGKGVLTDTRTGNTEHLGSLPAKVLDILTAHPNVVVEKKTILMQVWGNEWSGGSLGNIILQLRGLLKADARVAIETFRNVGYQLIVKP
ncbi:MAG: response regulator transcription factor [Bacteroides sp.]|nr:response regulator transcription factor [Bacteroides sp.]